MTVEELIEKLSFMPPGADVLFEARSVPEINKYHPEPASGKVDEVRKEMHGKWKCVLSGDLI